MNLFIIYEIFPSEDDFGTDPWEYKVELNGKIIAEFGDDYHEKGRIMSKGFIQGYAYAKGWKKKFDYMIDYEEIVDKTLD